MTTIQGALDKAISLTAGLHEARQQRDNLLKEPIQALEKALFEFFPHAIEKLDVGYDDQDRGTITLSVRVADENFSEDLRKTLPQFRRPGSVTNEEKRVDHAQEQNGRNRSFLNELTKALGVNLTKHPENKPCYFVRIPLNEQNLEKLTTMTKSKNEAENKFKKMLERQARERKQFAGR